MEPCVLSQQREHVMLMAAICSQGTGEPLGASLVAQPLPCLVFLFLVGRALVFTLHTVVLGICNCELIL